MNMPESHEERCRALAERISSSRPDDLNLTQFVFPDPRFAALRGKEHRYDPDGRCWSCKARDFQDDLEGDVEYTYCLRTDVGAVVLAFGAMDTPVTFACDDDEVWSAIPVQKERNGGGIPCVANGPSPEEAGSAALWQLVFGGKS